MNSGIGYGIKVSFLAPKNIKISQISYDTAYTVYFVHPNFGNTETSYMLGLLGDILIGGVGGINYG